MKKILLLLTTLSLLTSCSILFPNNSSEEGINKPTSNFDPWDKLGGGKLGVDGTEENTTLEDYNELITSVDSSKQDENIETNLVINFSDLSKLPDGVSHSSGLVYITKAGTYLLKGNLEGNIIVDKCNEQDVKLIFDNVNITSKGSSAPITFKKSNGKRIITLKENTVSTLKDSTSNFGDSADETLIEAKTVSLTINGKGNLNLISQSISSTGIECKDELFVINANIDINTTNHGIKVDKYIHIENANIGIKSKNDGIKTDITPISLEEAQTFANSLENGYIYIKNTNLNIDSGDDAILANSCIYISNKDTNDINIKTNSGTPNTINESVSNSVNGKGIKVTGITYLSGTNETIVDSNVEENYSIIIDGGNTNINANGDAISSRGNVLIESGHITVSSGDDGIHAEYLNTIRGGNINVSKSFEGIEGAGVEIYGGDIIVNSIDDGINASNSSTNYDAHIYIGGGNIEVNAEGDGVDSNGWMEISDGNLIINGPTGGMNGSLDSDKGILVKSGNILAVGSRGMVETPSSNSNQCYININLSSKTKDKIVIFDSSDNEIFSYTPTKEYQSVVLSLKQFEKGKTYYAQIGSNTYEATLNNIGTALGTNSSGNNNQGFIPGGRPPKR